MDSPRSKRLQITKDHRPSPISLPTDLVRSRERNREVLLSTSSFRSEPLRLSDPKPIRIASPIPFGYAYPYVTFRRPGGVPDAFWAIDARRSALRHRFARFRGRLEVFGGVCDPQAWNLDRVGSQEAVRGGHQTRRPGRTQTVSTVKFDEESTKNVAQTKRFDPQKVFDVLERRGRDHNVPTSCVERTRGIHRLVRRHRSTNGDAGHLDASCTLGRRQRRRS